MAKSTVSDLIFSSPIQGCPPKGLIDGKIYFFKQINANTYKCKFDDEKEDKLKYYANELLRKVFKF